MRAHEGEPGLITKLWPLRPSDAALVALTAILAAVFGSNGTDSSGWLWLWVGISAGLLIVLVKVCGRARETATPDLRIGRTHGQ